MGPSLQVTEFAAILPLKGELKHEIQGYIHILEAKPRLRSQTGNPLT